MKRKKRQTWFTKREIEICQTIMRYDSIQEAAKKLSLSPSTLYSVTDRVKAKITKSRFSVNVSNNWRHQCRTLARLLAPYTKVRILVTSQLPEEEGFEE